METHKGKLAEVWIKNSFHETRIISRTSTYGNGTYKWYILADYKTDFVKGKFKPSEDSLFKDGKEKNFQSDQAKAPSAILTLQAAKYKNLRYT